MDDALDESPERFDRLVEELRRAGLLADPAWEAALRAAPRHRFVPARVWIHRGRRLVELDRDRDPRAWWDAVDAADVPIFTQFDDGAGGPNGAGAAEPTSSCTAPAIQLQLLDALDVEHGMKVLEIGTGTGWNAALLAHRLGDAAVTSIEVDPSVARRAGHALAAVGREPRVLVQDGQLGDPAGAPYDRVVATCAVSAVPPAWVEQTRPGGVVVAPWMPAASPGGGPLARLTVAAAGTASGPFVANVSFMPLRQQRRAPQPPPSTALATAPADIATATTTVDPIGVLFRTIDGAFPAQLALGAGYYSFAAGRTSEETVVWLSDPARSSWARIHTPVPFEVDAPEGTRFSVEQHGPRKLWDEVETAHRWWLDAGRPGRLRFGLTVRPDAQVVWLDDPSNPIYLLPSPATPAFVATS